jgi:oxalate decarboxylase/phosphoglucose isomerase-like protein (cupin superfamily)
MELRIGRGVASGQPHRLVERGLVEKVRLPRRAIGFQVRERFAILVPAGARHSVKNTGNEPLKLYTLFGPPEHADGTVHATRAEAMASEEHFAGQTTEA